MAFDTVVCRRHCPLKESADVLCFPPSGHPHCLLLKLEFKVFLSCALIPLMIRKDEMIGLFISIKQSL